MKKLLSLLLCVLLLTALLTACGDDRQAKDTSQSHVPSQPDSVDETDRVLTSTVPSISTTPHSNHNHGTTTGDQVKYQIYTNADKTYRLVFRDIAGKMVAEFNNIAYHPVQEAIDAAKGIYELGWATGNGPSDFYCVYYNVHTGEVSQLFHAPRGTDGMRIAYGSEDQTKILVRDLFSSGSFYKEYPLENAYTQGEYIIIGSHLSADKKMVVVSYITDENGTTKRASIPLYE